MTINKAIHRVSKSSLLLGRLGLGLGLLVSTGCASSFKLKDAPPGFIEVSSSKYDGDAELRMKAPDNVGLNITTFANYRGGTLPLWAEDMIKKLSDRGYVLQGQEAVKSGNGVEGELRNSHAHTTAHPGGRGGHRAPRRLRRPDKRCRRTGRDSRGTYAAQLPV